MEDTFLAVQSTVTLSIVVSHTHMAGQLYEATSETNKHVVTKK